MNMSHEFGAAVSIGGLDDLVKVWRLHRNQLKRKIRMAFLGGLRRRIEDSHRQIIPHQGPAWCKRTKPAAKQRVNLPLSRRFHRDKVGDVLMCLPRYGCAGQASIAPALVMVMIMIFVNCW